MQGFAGFRPPRALSGPFRSHRRNTKRRQVPHLTTILDQGHWNHVVVHWTQIWILCLYIFLIPLSQSCNGNDVSQRQTRSTQLLSTGMKGCKNSLLRPRQQTRPELVPTQKLRDACVCLPWHIRSLFVTTNTRQCFGFFVFTNELHSAGLETPE